MNAPGMGPRSRLVLQRPAEALGLAAPTWPQAAKEIEPGISQHLAPGEEGVEQWWGCEAQRVQLAGGALFSLLMHPSLVPFERLYRRLPEEGMFDPSVSPERPFAFELGAFTVPSTFALMIFDMRPDIYRFSGIDAGDFIPVEERRFASIMGFAVTIDGRHHGNIEFQLDPVAVQTTALQVFTNKQQQQAPGQNAVAGAQLFSVAPGQGGGLSPTPPSVFNIAAASGFANAAGDGLGLLPQRPDRYGALSTPFTLYVKRGQTVQVRCVIFRPIPSPIAFIEFDFAGFMVPEQWLESILHCVKPVSSSIR